MSEADAASGWRLIGAGALPRTEDEKGDWIPAFAGMTVVALVASIPVGCTCVDRRDKADRGKNGDWIPAFAGMTVVALVAPVASAASA